MIDKPKTPWKTYETIEVIERFGDTYEHIIYAQDQDDIVWKRSIDHKYLYSPQIGKVIYTPIYATVWKRVKEFTADDN